METKLMLCPVCGGTLYRKANRYACESCGAVQEILSEEQEYIPQEIWTEAEKLFEEARKIAGKDGLLQLRAAAGYHSELTTEGGALFPCGYASPRFGNEDESVLCFEPNILTVTGESTLRRLLVVLERIISDVPETVVFLADKIDGELLETLVINWERGALKCIAILLPENGPERERLLAATQQLGCRILDSSTAGESFCLQDLGSVRKAIVTSDRLFLLDERLHTDMPVVTVHTGGENKQEQELMLKACQKLLKEGAISDVR